MLTSAPFDAKLTSHLPDMARLHFCASPMTVGPQRQRGIDATVGGEDAVLVESRSACPAWQAGIEHLPDARERDERGGAHAVAGYAAMVEVISEPVTANVGR